MKKLLSLFAVACVSLCAMATATVFDFSASAEAQTLDGFTVSLGKGTGNNPPAVYDNGVRMYANNMIAVSGGNITKVELTFAKQGSKAYAGLTASEGELVPGGESTADTDPKTDVWTGNADSVTFTLGTSGQRLIRRIVINRAEGEELPGGGDPVDPQPVEADTLDPAYNYAEPTEVRVSGEATGNNMPYSFIKNNIQVSCTKGAITENYFGCNAAERITFTATKPIKGLTVKGYVKKDFEATSTAGQISYMSTTDPDGATGDPVLVITDVDSTSVIISCVKQLRCYSVLFYFEANPTDTVEGGVSGEGETFFLEFTGADAVYETTFSEEGNENYTLFLYNENDEFHYIGLDLYTPVLGQLEGVHELGEYSFYSFGENDNDYASNVEGQVAINKDGDTYTISGYMTCDDNNTYNFTFSGPIVFYTDDEYYYGDEGIEKVYPALDANAPMYDILGRPVGKGYKGLVIQNGYKYLVR